MTDNDLILAKLFQDDVRFFYTLSRAYRSSGDIFLSIEHQRIAARMSKLARHYMGIQ